MLWGVLEDSPCWPLAAATHLEPRHAGGCPRLDQAAAVPAEVGPEVLGLHAPPRWLA